jgi:aspartate aminotransferase
MNLSQRLSTVPASPIRKLVPYAQAAKQQGVTVYHLNIGDPDILTPKIMLEKLRSWKQNPIGYAQSKGEPAFLTAMTSYYHSLGYLSISEADIQVTVGGSEAIGMALFAICNPGDEILVFEPFYANYSSYAALYEVTLIAVPTLPENGFHLPSKSEIEQFISNQTKGILLCNPNNPTGTVYSKAEMDTIAEIALERQLFVLSDEVYREFVYDQATHISVLSYLDRLGERVILLDSLSKRYSLCGARLGVLVSQQKELMGGVLRIAQGRLSAGLIDQHLGAALTGVPPYYTTQVLEEYQQRRDILYQGLSQIPGVSVTKPEGAFYCIAGLPVADADHFCQWLLTDFRDNNETVMLAPASGFYANKDKGINQVRIAYVLEQQKLKRALTILRKALEVYHV